MILRVTRNGLIEHRAPPRESEALRYGGAEIVRDIVDEPHESVQRAKGIALFLAQAEKCQIKAAVRLARDPVAFRIRRTHAFGRSGSDSGGDHDRDRSAVGC